jgi:hypothetical protein
MAQRRHHYERALEAYLRERRVPYVAVNEAKKALLPRGADLTMERDGERRSLKGFDFVVYGNGSNLLLEAKGRRLPRLRLKDGSPAKARLESWVTRDDVESLRAWSTLFGEGFEPVFVFVYWCDDVPPDGLFSEVFEHGGRWYTLRCVTLGDYAACMKTRSPKWGTVNLPAADYERLWRRLLAAPDASWRPDTPEAAMDLFGEPKGGSVVAPDVALGHA